MTDNENAKAALTKLDALEKRLSELDNKLEKHIEKFDTMDKRLAAHDKMRRIEFAIEQTHLSHKHSQHDGLPTRYFARDASYVLMALYSFRAGDKYFVEVPPYAGGEYMQNFQNELRHLLGVKPILCKEQNANGKTSLVMYYP